MTLPAFLLGLLIASLYGALFHFWRGGGPGRLFFYLALSWAGFWGGHFLGVWRGWAFAPLGPLDLGWATLGAIVLLLIGYWLSLVEVGRE